MMTTIKTSLSKVLTLAVVALTVLFSFAVNPAVAQPLGYCCDLDFKLQNSQQHECLVDYTYSYFSFADLTNESDKSAIVLDPAGEKISIPPLTTIDVDLYPSGTYILQQGSGPVSFDCDDY